MRRVLAAALLLGTVGVAGLANATEVGSSDAGHAQNPSWSPDGKWLAFEVNNMANSVELYLSEVNSGVPKSPQKLAVPGASSSLGGGGSIAASAVWGTNPSLMVIFEGSNAGGTMRLYYASPGKGAPGELIQAAQMTGNLNGPTMSQDGKRMAFVSDSTGNGDIYVWELSSGEMKATFPTDFSEHFPAWDPNADKLAFSRKNQGTEDLFVWDGSGVKPLKGGNGDQTRPAWAGDKVVYFSSERGDGHWDIAVAVPGGSREIIAQDVRLPTRSAPDITPDGQWVSYGSADPDKGDGIYFTRLDGSSTVAVPTGMVACGEPDTSSSGGRTWLAFTALPSEGSAWRKLHVMDITGAL